MPVVTAEGFTQPFQGTEPYDPPFGTLIPALRGFRLTYPAPNDHEINLIQVWVGGDSQDLSPTADLSPLNIPDGSLWALLQDASPSGEGFGYYVSHSTYNVPRARRFQIRDVGCVGECVTTIPLGTSFPAIPSVGGQPVLALVGFRFFFIGGQDRRLDRIGVWFSDNDLHVFFSDDSSNATYAYSVDFVTIPRLGLNIATGTETGSSSGLETIALNTPFRSEFLLTGWEFDFQDGDREILDIGIIRGLNDLTVFYGDEGGGEQFDWRVEWAHVGPMVFAPPD